MKGFSLALKNSGLDVIAFDFELNLVAQTNLLYSPRFTRTKSNMSFADDLCLLIWRQIAVNYTLVLRQSFTATDVSYAFLLLPLKRA